MHKENGPNENLMKGRKNNEGNGNELKKKGSESSRNERQTKKD